MRIFIRLYHYGHFLWNLLVLNIRLLWGMWKLTRLPQPAITVFGGARVKLDSKHGKMASSLTRKLAKDGFSVITGGGPGIMEAANFGVFDYVRECKAGGKECKEILSVGIGVSRLNIEKENAYVHQQIVMSHFFSRKWLLVRYAMGFIVFPGGFGTLDELFEIVTLRQTEKMQRAPIILMDSKYWMPIISWAKDQALVHGLVSQEDIDLLIVLDDVDEAAAIIKKYCSQCSN